MLKHYLKWEAKNKNGKIIIVASRLCVIHLARHATFDRLTYMK